MADNVYEYSRRDVLKSTVVGGGIMVGLAGCASNDGGGGTKNQDGGDEYPSKEITAVIPWGAGGGTDTTTRQFEPYYEDELGVDLVPENRAGASSRQGMNYFATVEPDGYTLAFNDTIINICASALYETQFDPFTLTPIGNMVASFSAIFIEPGKYDGWAALRAELEDDSTTTNIGTSGRGSASDYHFEDLMERLEIPVGNYTMVPSDSGAEAAQMPASPDADASIAILTQSSIGFHNDGLTEVVFHMQDVAESPFVPEAETLQTIEEDIPEIPFAPGIWGPPELSEEKATFLDEARASATQAEEYQQMADEQGLTVQNMNGEELSQLLESLSDAPEMYVRRIEAARS